MAVDATGNDAQDQQRDAAKHIAEHARRIRESRLLSRSSQLSRLLDYLYECHQQRRVPKEFEIAVEALGRHKGFDVSQDALVRVYVHKLRRKLDDYYLGAGQCREGRITIPKGEYKLLWQSAGTEANDQHDPPPSKKRSIRPRVLAIAAALLVSIGVNVFLYAQAGFVLMPQAARLRASSLWAPLFADDRPIVIVVGDYYIFAESDSDNSIKRLVRDFEINSPVDLATHLQRHPAQADRQFDIGLAYLPTSSVYAVNKVDTVLATGRKKPWGVVLSSELIPENLRNSDIVYIGHLSAMGILEDWVFSNSGFRLGGSYDELVDKATGKRFTSSSGIPTDLAGLQTHLAYLASFPGPANNRLLIVAGCRDAGLKELADLIVSESGLAELLNTKPGSSFEALYQFGGAGAGTRREAPILIRELTAGVPERPPAAIGEAAYAR